MEQTTRYQVICNRTGQVCGTYRDRNRARRRADRLDLEYGAIGYHVRRVKG